MIPEEFFLEYAIFTTRHFSTAVNIRVDSATRTLNSYAKKKFIVKVTRGLWANTKHRFYSPYALVPFLLSSEQGYVSFLSALQKNGVISQIPQKIFIATTGHSRRLTSKCGNFEFLQLKPNYMRVGINWMIGDIHYGIASAEKALLDCLYISSRRNQRFSHFPELDFSHFKKKTFFKLLKEHHFPVSIENYIHERFINLCTKR
jgi:predicted transcriptional regulator of viral defense system